MAKAKVYDLLMQVGKEDLVQALCNYHDSAALEEFVGFLVDEGHLPDDGEEDSDGDSDEDSDE